jgi:predicted dehydrogenase
MADQQSKLRVALVGCGAISELYYAPAFKEAAKHACLEITALCDPSPSRLEALQVSFPAAQAVTAIEELISLSPDLAIVASPPRFHSSQANALLAAGAHVLCEKPMASSVLEADSMIMAAARAKRVLAIGLFRRFFPALQTIHSLVSGGVLGRPLSFVFSEGGPFNWPAASASFFQRQHSQGGVLLDLGVHALDLVCWWFGEPSALLYQDDAMGNLEANCHLSLSFPGGLAGQVRLSRDTPISNQYSIAFENGQIIWSVGDANHLDVRLNGVPLNLQAELRVHDSPAATYHQSFVNQLLNVAAAVRGSEPVSVPAEEGIRSLRIIEACYQSRELMHMPWLSDAESRRARELVLG